MPTRFYLPATLAADVAPAYTASWNQTAAADRRKAVTAKITETDATKLATLATTSGQDTLIRQYVSASLPSAVTITGTVKGQIGAQERVAADDVRAQMVIRVVSSDGLTVRGTLLAANTGATLTNEFPFGSVNRKFPVGWVSPGATLTSVSALAGDRIVIEVGVRGYAVPGAGDWAQLYFGTALTGDLAENETAPASSGAPWVEFSQTLFQTSGTIVKTGVLLASGLPSAGYTQTLPDADVRGRLAFGPTAVADVSGELRSFTVRRGRQWNLARIEAGSADVELTNPNGVLDPSNATGPYYGQILPLQELLLERQTAGVRYPRFRGRTERLKPRWQPPYFQNVDLFASDAFESLANIQLLSPKSSLQTAFAGADNDLLFTARESGDRGLQTTVTFVVAGNNTVLGSATNNPFPNQGVLLSADTSNTTVDQMSGAVLGGTVSLHGVSGSVPTLATVQVQGTDITVNVATGATGLATSTAAQVKAALDANPAVAALVSVALAPGNAGTGVVAAMAKTNLSGGQFPAELSGARINRCLDLAGWPAGRRRVDPGAFQVVAQGIGESQNVSVLGHIQEVADSELGYVFVAGDGYMVFHAGDHRTTVTRSTVVQATFSDDGTGLPFRAVDMALDKDRIANEVTVTAAAAGAVPQTVTDAGSQALYGRRVVQKTTLLVSDTDALTVANAILNAYKTPKIRFDRVELQDTRLAGWDAAVLGREIGDLVTVRTNPPAHTTTVAYDCFVEAVEDRRTVGEPWTVAFQLTPQAQSVSTGGAPPSGGGGGTGGGGSGGGGTGPLKDSSGDDLTLDSATLAVLG